MSIPMKKPLVASKNIYNSITIRNCNVIPIVLIPTKNKESHIPETLSSASNNKTMNLAYKTGGDTHDNKNKKSTKLCIGNTIQ